MNKIIVFVLLFSFLFYNCEKKINTNKKVILKDSLNSENLDSTNKLKEIVILKNTQNKDTSNDSVLLQKTIHKIITKLRNDDLSLCIYQFDLLDVNYDGHNDLLIAIQGAGLTLNVVSYLFNPKLKTYNTEIYEEFGRPVFHLKKKKICIYTPFAGGGLGFELNWIKNEWVLVKEIHQEIDSNYVNCEWIVKNKLNSKTDTIHGLFELFPPKAILELEE